MPNFELSYQSEQLCLFWIILIVYGEFPTNCGQTKFSEGIAMPFVLDEADHVILKFAGVPYFQYLILR